MEHVSMGDFGQLSWLVVTDCINFFKLIHIFKIRNGTAPSYISCDLKLISQTHSYNTRGCIYDYFVSKELSNAPTSFAYTAIKQWNSLPVYLKEIRSESVFRVKLKQFYLSRY